MDAAAALGRNDRYLREFVEALGLCPFARPCREAGKLHRRVLADASEALPAIAEIEALPEESVEVALLIFPSAQTGSREAARAFEELCRETREALALRHAGRSPPFYCVAFHPDLPDDASDENRAVHFIRRSPDPTLQFVRASVLAAARGARTGGSICVDAGQLSAAELLAVSPPAGLSDEIARRNLEALRRAGLERLAQLLAGMRR